MDSDFGKEVIKKSSKDKNVVFPLHYTDRSLKTNDGKSSRRAIKDLVKEHLENFTIGGQCPFFTKYTIKNKNGKTSTGYRPRTVLFASYRQKRLRRNQKPNKDGKRVLKPLSQKRFTKKRYSVRLVPKQTVKTKKRQGEKALKIYKIVVRQEHVHPLWTVKMLKKKDTVRAKTPADAARTMYQRIKYRETDGGFTKNSNMEHWEEDPLVDPGNTLKFEVEGDDATGRSFQQTGTLTRGNDRQVKFPGKGSETITGRLISNMGKRKY